MSGREKRQTMSGESPAAVSASSPTPVAAGRRLPGTEIMPVGPVVSPDRSGGTPETDWPEALTPMDFPPGRRENFIWHYAWRAGLSLTTDLTTGGFVGVDCRWWTTRNHPDAPQHALLGTDGQ